MHFEYVYHILFVFHRKKKIGVHHVFRKICEIVKVLRETGIGKLIFFTDFDAIPKRSDNDFWQTTYGYACTFFSSDTFRFNSTVKFIY